MNKLDLTPNNIFSNDSQTAQDFKIYALESFAREIDYQNQTELLTKLILDQSAISKRLEQLNKELEHSREVLDEAQEIALIGRWDMDAGHENMTWSRSVYNILEIEPSTPPSRDLYVSFIHPDDIAWVGKLYHEMNAARKPWATRYRLLLKNGKTKWVHFRFHFKTDENGEPIHCYGTVQDITEMKKVENELEKYSQRLEMMVEEKIREISFSQVATIYALIKLSGSRDDETGAHIERTASFCRLLAQKARSRPEYADIIDDSFIEAIYKASPLHDIGKVGVPDRILLKPGRLTPEEFEIMKTHVQIGHETISKVGQLYDKNEFLKMGMEIALYHHEKWDGSGYNKGLKGDEIPLSARIMAISDVYDALRSKRVYKDAYSHEKSMEIIAEGKGKHFDPVLVDVLIEEQEDFKLLYESIKDSE